MEIIGGTVYFKEKYVSICKTIIFSRKKTNR